MLFDFNQLSLPKIPDRLKGPEYEEFKSNLTTIMLSQRFQVFTDQASREGPWKPLAPATIRERQSRLSGRKGSAYSGINILIDTGVLRQSLSPGGNSNQIKETHGDTVKIATNVKYARIQNQGGTIQHPGTENGFGKRVKIGPHRITIDARPFDQFTDDNVTDLAEFTEKYINGKL